MQSLFASVLQTFLSWWGALILSALDSSLFFFLPLANDMLLVYLAARHPRLFWLYPLLVTAGSAAGAASTYLIGEKMGQKGLPKLVSKRRLERFEKRVKDSGAIAMALPAILPPPFPLTAFVLMSGAFQVSRRRLFIAFASARLLRFGIEAVFARRYGDHVLEVLESVTFRYVIVGFAVVAVVGTGLTIVMLWRGTRA